MPLKIRITQFPTKLWIMFVGINGVIIIGLIFFTESNTKYLLWLFLICFNFVFMILGFPVIGHEYKRRWSFWQLKIDLESFKLFSYLSENKGEDYIWNGHQTQFFGSSYWANEALKYIKQGDKIVFWVHGEPLGIYAIGEVAHRPYYSKIPENHHRFYLDRKGLDSQYAQVPVKITVDLFSRPITQAETRRMRISQYRHPIFGTLYDSNPPKKRGSIVNYSFEDFRGYGEGIIDEYGNFSFLPLNKWVWEQVVTNIQTRNSEAKLRP